MSCHRLKSALVRWLFPFGLALGLVLLLLRSTQASGQPGFVMAEADQRLKLEVAQDGFYQVTYDDLIAAGFSLDGMDPRLLQMTVGGVEIALWVVGEEDGRFDPGDWLLFYGEAVDTVYTDVNVYWLSFAGSPGLRMGSRSVTPSGQPPLAQRFTDTIGWEVNSFYWQTMPGLLGADRWFWGSTLTAPETRGYPLPTPGLLPEHTAQVYLHLHSYTAAPGNGHQVRVRLNGTEVGAAAWNGITPMTVTATISAHLLSAQTNLLELEAVAGGQSPSRWHLDRIGLTYQRAYSVEKDSLVFTGPTAGRHTFQLHGFQESEPVVFDVTAPRSPVRLTGVITGSSDAGHFAHFEDDTASHSRLHALTSSRFLKPVLRLDSPSTWRMPTQGADYLVVAHRDFIQTLTPLISHRQSQGLQAVVVDVEDVYDEFNAGVFDPQAIRDFLAYAWQNWQPRPRYVLLVGDGNQDYRDYLDSGVPNTLPAALVLTAELGETPSDEWYGAVNGDDPVAEMSIGRLSVRNPLEAGVVISKLLAYEAAQPDAEWKYRALMVADSGSGDYESLTEKLIRRLPANVHAQTLYARTIAPEERTQRIAAAWNQGAFLVNYSGHGSPRYWGRTPFFGPSDYAGLTNDIRLPVVLVANCLNGFFTDPIAEGSLAEQLQRLPGGGAVAVFAPTGLFYPAGHEELFKALYEELFSEETVILGDAIIRAKNRLYAQDPFWGELVETYTLFGDPAMRLSPPTRSRLFLPQLQVTH